MDFRLADMNDLIQIKEMFKDITAKMNKDNIQIWDEIYPCDFFEDDIKNNRLYIMSEGADIVAGFAMCGSNSGDRFIEWKDNNAKALYIDRFGVNVKYHGKGLGSYMLNKAKETAKSLGAEYLRLFVVDINTPAAFLYCKNGFNQAKGIYDEVIDGDFILREYGYEIKL